MAGSTLLEASVRAGRVSWSAARRAAMLKAITSNETIRYSALSNTNHIHGKVGSAPADSALGLSASTRPSIATTSSKPRHWVTLSTPHRNLSPICHRNGSSSENSSALTRHGRERSTLGSHLHGARRFCCRRQSHRGALAVFTSSCHCLYRNRGRAYARGSVRNR